jgi:hypothetical protein
VRHLNIQVQPERAASLDIARVIDLIEALAHDHNIVAGFDTTKGEDEGPYVNFTYLSKDPATLWKRIESDVLAHPQLGRKIAQASIIVCEGANGWDDYLLLHHFDRTMVLDSADEL